MDCLLNEVYFQNNLSKALLLKNMEPSQKAPPPTMLLTPAQFYSIDTVMTTWYWVVWNEDIQFMILPNIEV